MEITSNENLNVADQSQPSENLTPPSNDAPATPASQASGGPTEPATPINGKRVSVGSLKEHDQLPPLTAADNDRIEKIKQDLLDKKTEVPPLHLLPDGRCLVGRIWWKAAEAARLAEVPAIYFPSLENNLVGQIEHFVRFDQARDRLGEAALVKLGIQLKAAYAELAKVNRSVGGRNGARAKKGEKAAIEPIKTRNALADAAREVGVSPDYLRRGELLYDAYVGGRAPIWELFELGVLRLYPAHRLFDAGTTTETQGEVVAEVKAVTFVDKDKEEHERKSLALAKVKAILDGAPTSKAKKAATATRRTTPGASSAAESGTTPASVEGVAGNSDDDESERSIAGSIANGMEQAPVTETPPLEIPSEAKGPMGVVQRAIHGLAVAVRTLCEADPGLAQTQSKLTPERRHDVLNSIALLDEVFSILDDVRLEVEFGEQ